MNDRIAKGLAVTLLGIAAIILGIPPVTRSLAQALGVNSPQMVFSWVVLLLASGITAVVCGGALVVRSLHDRRVSAQLERDSILRYRDAADRKAAQVRRQWNKAARSLDMLLTAPEAFRRESEQYQNIQHALFTLDGSYMGWQDTLADMKRYHAAAEAAEAQVRESLAEAEKLGVDKLGYRAAVLIQRLRGVHTLTDADWAALDAILVTADAREAHATHPKTAATGA